MGFFVSPPLFSLSLVSLFCFSLFLRFGLILVFVCHFPCCLSSLSLLRVFFKVKIRKKWFSDISVIKLIPKRCKPSLSKSVTYSPSPLSSLLTDIPLLLLLHLPFHSSFILHPLCCLFPPPFVLVAVVLTDWFVFVGELCSGQCCSFGYRIQLRSS